MGIVWSLSSLLEVALVRGSRSGVETSFMAFDRILAIFLGPILLYKVSSGGVDLGVGLLTVDM